MITSISFHVVVETILSIRVTWLKQNILLYYSLSGPELEKIINLYIISYLYYYPAKIFCGITIAVLSLRVSLVH